MQHMNERTVYSPYLLIFFVRQDKSILAVSNYKWLITNEFIGVWPYCPNKQ